MIHEARQLCEFEEILGDCRSVQETQGYCLAQIGRISVLLPLEMAGRLKPLLGCRVGILRLDGYRLCCLDDKKAKTIDDLER
jgi:hypothetical protein